MVAQFVEEFSKNFGFKFMTALANTKCYIDCCGSGIQHFTPVLTEHSEPKAKQKKKIATKTRQVCVLGNDKVQPMYRYLRLFMSKGTNEKNTVPVNSKVFLVL
jgi:hypothetical protein